MKAIIIEDEDRARAMLNEIIKTYCTDVEIVGLAADLPEGIKLIHKTKPDLVFLDIEMPLFSGLQLLDFFNVEDVFFEIVFVTAYSDYAVQAFQLSAVDYLLKPIVIEQLIQAIEKVKKRRAHLSMHTRMEALKTNLLPDTKTLTVSLPVSDGLLFVPSDEIMYLKAEGSYTQFVFIHREPILVSKNLKSFERLLGLKTFFRTSRSYIINLLCVTQFVKKDGGFVVLSNGAEIQIPPNRRDELISLIENRTL